MNLFKFALNDNGTLVINNDSLKMILAFIAVDLFIYGIIIFFRVYTNRKRMKKAYETL